MVEIELMKFLRPVSWLAAAAFILGVFVDLSNFPADGLDEVVIWKAGAVQLIEPVKNIVGVHVSLKFS